MPVADPCPQFSKCNDDDRCQRQKQGGVVVAAVSRMQDPPKGRSIRWEPQPGGSLPCAELLFVYVRFVS